MYLLSFLVLQSPNKTKFKNYFINYLNKKEYHTLKREIFNDEIYSFENLKNVESIIDIGSHIGLSIVYFKEKYPNSNIISFEPNPINFELLEKNIFENNLKNVECIQKTVSSNRGPVFVL